jgi:small subunit ribosomal protein S3Ae
MAKGKNKNNYATKKSSNKQEKGALAKKEWFKIRAPTGFSPAPFGYTCINETAGTHISTEAIKGRVCDIAYEEIREKASNENDKQQ